MLHAQAPVLASTLAAHLEPPPPQPQPQPVRRAPKPWALWIYLLVAGAGLIRVLAAASSSPRSDPLRYSPPRFTPVPVLSLPLLTPDAGTWFEPSGVRKTLTKLRAEELRARADYGLSDAGPRRKKVLVALSDAAGEVADALEREDCVAARAHARDLRRAWDRDAGRGGDEPLRVMVVELEQAVVSYCDGLDDLSRH
jgi:hypothetical protein